MNFALKWIDLIYRLKKEIALMELKKLKTNLLQEDSKSTAILKFGEISLSAWTIYETLTD
tara:strand:+ start:290 stop:469 length:180 start_codon:yes stop_codon:yes gene_type:complete